MDPTVGRRRASDAPRSGDRPAESLGAEQNADVARELEAARARTLALLEPIGDAELVSQHSS